MRRSSYRSLIPAVLAALASCPVPALASSGDAAATHAYIEANYALVHNAQTRLAQMRRGPAEFLKQVRSECPLIAAESPQDPESTQLSYELIGAIVISAGKPELPAIHRFLATTGALHWSDPRVEHPLREYIQKLKTLSGLQVPHVCRDVRAWIAGGYRSLPAATISFDKVFEPSWVALGLLPHPLLAIASSADRALVRRSKASEAQVMDFEASEVENYRLIMNAVALNP